MSTHSSMRIPQRAEHVPVTLLFSDVVHSTQLTLALGDVEAKLLMDRYKALIRGIVADWDGDEVEELGDGFLFAFPSAEQGVQCAIAIQRALAQFRRNHCEDLRVRIGVHSGEAIPVRGRYFGSDVIRCSRISTAAGSDEIVVSESTARAAHVDPKSFGVPRLEAMKGFEGLHALVPVRWEPPARQPLYALPTETMGACAPA